MKPDDLIATARDLLSTGRGAPRQSNLRRAVSTTYYALFHCLARCCADSMVGTVGARRSEEAWQQAYRALEHGQAAARCQLQLVRHFPIEVRNFAGEFSRAQFARHEADYEAGGRWQKSKVDQFIVGAESALQDFKRVSLKDRKAFAVHLTLKRRAPQSARLRQS